MDEKTSFAIVAEIDWLLSGQPVKELSKTDRGQGPGKDEYGRPLYDYTPQAPRVSSLREAARIANERAVTRTFESPAALEFVPRDVIEIIEEV